MPHLSHEFFHFCIFFQKRSIFWKEGLQRRGIILYLEYQTVCPFVQIGSPHPLSRKRVCHGSPLPLWNQKVGGNTRQGVRGRGEPIRTTGEKAWHSVYSVVYSKTDDRRKFIDRALLIGCQQILPSRLHIFFV